MLRRQSRKLGLVVILLLVLSQGLSLVHATGHHLESGDTDCRVCLLQHQFHSVTLEAKPWTAEFTVQGTPCLAAYLAYRTTFLTDRTIRAPPVTP